MLRRWIIIALAFALPFLAYWAFTAWQRRSARRAGRPPPQADWPRTILWVTGLVLALEALTLGILSDPGGQGRYVPARVDAEGKLIPAHFEPVDE